jgi:hypothetical protein
MSSPARRRRAAVAAGVLLTASALVLTGCSSGSGGSGKSATPTRPASVSAKAAPGLPKGVKALTKVPVDVPNNPDLRRQVAIASCKATHRGWQATGTATNTTKKSRTYRITVFYTTQSATVIGAARTQVTLAPGAQKSWTATDRFAAPKNTLCVLRGVG